MADPILKGKNFILRYPTIKDLEGYYKNQTDKVVRKMFMSTPKNIKEARKELLGHIKINRKKKKTSEYFIIDINGEAVGVVWISGISYGYEKHRAGIGYFIGKEYRGQGITTNAVKLITRYAFKRYKLKRLWAPTRTFNKASRRMLENAGFKLEGILRKNKWKDGKYLDDCIYAIVK